MTLQQIEVIAKNAVANAVAPIGKLVHIVCNLMVEANNLWTKTQIADSVTNRSEKFRKKLVSHLGYDTTKGKRKRISYTCMVTGLQSDADDIEAAHIVPAKSVVKGLACIGMTVADVNDVRNGLLLATAIHKAFDHLQSRAILSRCSCT